MKSCHRALTKLGADKHDDDGMRKALKKLAFLVRFGLQCRNTCPVQGKGYGLPRRARSQGHRKGLGAAT